MWINISEPRVAPRGQNFFWDLSFEGADPDGLFNVTMILHVCATDIESVDITRLGRILIHIIFLFPMDGTGDGFGRLVLRSAYGTAPHPFGGLNFTRAQRRVVKRGEARQPPSLSANPFFVQLFVEANVFQLIKLRTNLCELAGNVGLGGPFACGHRFSRAQRRCPTYYDLARLYNTVPEKATCMIASAGERSMRIY